jgi:hypothetical protein
LAFVVAAIAEKKGQPAIFGTLAFFPARPGAAVRAASRPPAASGEYALQEPA